MKQLALSVFSATVALAQLPTLHSNPKTTYILFAIPGCSPVQPTAINDFGVIVGSCGSAPARGFIRDPFGRITLFSVGAGDTIPTGINIHGAITGYIPTQDTVNYASFADGWVRDPSGAVTMFHYTWASLYPTAINASGVIAGTGVPSYMDGFIRTPDGKLTFLLSYPYTKNSVTGLNDNGEVTGAAFSGARDVPLGYLRTADGSILFVGPLDAQYGQDDYPIAINAQGAVLGSATAGLYTPTPLTRGFIQPSGQAAIQFDAPGLHPAGMYPPFAQLRGGLNAHNRAALGNLYVELNGDKATTTMISLGACSPVTAVAINNFNWVTGSCGNEGFLWAK